MEGDLQSSGDPYRHLHEHLLGGLAYCRMIYEDEVPVDWIYLDVNSAFEVVTGLKGTVGKRVTELIPGIRQTDPSLFEIYGRVASTGKPEHFETYVRGLDIWFEVSVYSPAKGHFVAVFDVVTVRKAVEEALRRSEQRFRTTFERAPVGIALTDPNGRWIELNPTFCRMLGYQEAELLGKSFVDVTVPEDLERQHAADSRLRTGDVDSFTLEKRYVRKDGAVVWGKVTAALVRKPGGEPDYSVAIVEDITAIKQTAEDKERLQGQLLQAHKMESIGRLAGGVAHDFNNALQVIMGFGELAAKDLDPQSTAAGFVESMRVAARRAADLTHQLLAFARRQAVSPHILDLNETVAGSLKMLGRLIGEAIELLWHPGHDIWKVKVDPAQVDQILANLCANARDAIGSVGRIIIETSNVEFDGAYCASHPGFTRGRYVALSLSDNGGGMTKEVLEHLFEPYFTTKGVGRGTGLGLSMVYGIVKQNGGFVNVYSEVAKGTTFRLYFPRVEGDDVAALEPAEAVIQGRGETILLVEDDRAILEVGRMMLEGLGYCVLPIADGEAAIDAAECYPGGIDILITDVIMPRIDGRQVADRIRISRPDLKVLFVSGYTANVIRTSGGLGAGVHFLQKPFSSSQLAEAVSNLVTKDGGR